MIGITTASRLDAAKSLAEKGGTTLYDLNKKGPDPDPKKKIRLIVAHTSPTVMVGLSVCQKNRLRRSGDHFRCA